MSTAGLGPTGYQDEDGGYAVEFHTDEPPVEFAVTSELCPTCQGTGYRMVWAGLHGLDLAFVDCEPCNATGRVETAHCLECGADLPLEDAAAHNCRDG